MSERTLGDNTLQLGAYRQPLQDVGPRSEHHDLLGTIMEKWDCDVISSMPPRTHAVYLLGKERYGTTDLAVKIGRQSIHNAGIQAEATALAFLNEYSQAHPAPLEIPRLIEYRPKSNVLITTALEGFSEEHAALGPVHAKSVRRAIGRKVGEYTAWLGAIPLDVYQERIADTRAHWDTYVTYTESVLDRRRYPQLATVADDIMGSIRRHYPNGIEAGTGQVVHSDFRTDNAVFNDSRITGAIDFEHLQLADPAVPMRGIYTPDEITITACAEAYEELTGQPVDIHRARSMFALQSLMTLVDQLHRDVPELPWVSFSQSRLMMLYPDHDWSEVYQKITEHYMPALGDWNGAMWNASFGPAARVPHKARNDQRRTMTGHEHISCLDISEPWQFQPFTT